MKKLEQIAVNEKVESVYRKAIAEIKCCGGNGPTKRLVKYQAYVHETDNYYYLYSYNKIVAVIDKSTDTLYDFLRLVSGFTYTSAQHIAKFSFVYGSGKWGCKKTCNMVRGRLTPIAYTVSGTKKQQRSVVEWRIKSIILSGKILRMPIDCIGLQIRGIIPTPRDMNVSLIRPIF